MVGTSKILTVSYGTFSCTLEGFDDSFNTMKAIAEYFRGLASDDRYFGAEPPTPDAEMLARIAEGEISRRVDARMDDGAIVLRAAELSDQSDAPSDVADDAEPHHDKDTRAEVDVARKAAKTERKAAKAALKAQEKAEKVAKKAAAKAKADADAAKAAEVKAEADAHAKAIADADAIAAEDARDAAASQNSKLESESAATADVSEGTPGSEVEETRNDTPSSMLAAKDPVPEPSDTHVSEQVAPAHPDADSVAAKLQRIRAIVSKSGTTDTDPSDDLTEQFLPQTEAGEVTDAKDVSAEDASVDAAHTADDVDTGISTPHTRVVRMKRADFEAAMAKPKVDSIEDATADATPTGPDFAVLDGADELEDYLEDSDFTDMDLSMLDDSDLAEDLQAIQDDASDNLDDDGTVSQDDAAQDSASDQENTKGNDVVADAVAATLADQLDAVEQTVDTPKVEEVVEPALETEEDSAANLMADDPQIDDAALDRLMNETDAKMQEPEGSRRRDAISQLKAAVAAKEAARQVGERDDDDQDVENAFRNDLSEAVRPEGDGAMRPRPVVRSENRTERPRPAPLKLVAAQRIDTGAATVRRENPVTPRRVAASKIDPNAPRASGSFAEFADNMGATELPDLLEAAAAYTSFVEGADEFSRPQILRRVRSVASDDFKREDELRSFADLISTGRFTKVRNGRFQVADDSRFNPERRAG